MGAEDRGSSPSLGVGERVLRVDAEHRGSTTFGSDVVARIASQAAAEVPHVGAAAGGVLGVGARRRFDARPQAECELYGRSAVLRLEVGCDFPAPLASVLSQLRTHVAERVESLTGIEVGRMDVQVSWLNPVDRVRKELA